METKYLYSVQMGGYPLRICLCKVAVLKETDKTFYFASDGREAGYNRSARKTSPAEESTDGRVAAAGSGYTLTIFFASANEAIAEAQAKRRAEIEKLQAEIAALDAERERLSATLER